MPLYYWPMQNGKAAMLAALNRKPVERVPCAPHWWGSYKYEVQGLDPRRDCWRDGEGLAPVYERFYERFRPDWFHLAIGTPRWFRESRIEPGEGGPLLAIESRFRAQKAEDRYFSFRSADDEPVVDFADLILGSRVARPKAELGSLSGIDAYVRDRIHMDSSLIEELGYTDHVRRIAERYGAEALVIVNLPSPVCEIFDPLTGYLGFEAGLLAIHDHPEGLQRLLERCYESHLEWARAYARAGAHAFVVSETFISPDIVGPEVYRRFLKGLHREYFGEIEGCGLIPICYFLGDVNPLLQDLTEIGIRALLVEESKKNFRLEAGEIWRRLEGRLALFGNLDSIAVLQDGKPEEVRAEVLRQAEAAPSGFIVANGSPITPGTPPENLEAMIRASREAHTGGKR
jgi:uroporphyrinogen-III decarboxylase